MPPRFPFRGAAIMILTWAEVLLQWEIEDRERGGWH